MKDRKRFIIVFAIFWIIGLLGGYYLGVGSSMVPSESIEYNYFFSEKASGSDVEPIKKNCDSAEDEDDTNYLHVLVRKVGVDQLPQRIADFFSPQ